MLKMFKVKSYRILGYCNVACVNCTRCYMFFMPVLKAYKLHEMMVLYLL
jgi:hypothetical protein